LREYDPNQTRVELVANPGIKSLSYFNDIFICLSDCWTILKSGVKREGIKGLDTRDLEKGETKFK
jgi:hypothetical protein